MDVVKADPNIAPEKTIKTLRWRRSSERRRLSLPGWLAWVAALFNWFAQSGRTLMWCTVAALAGVLVIYLLRLVRRFEAGPREAAFVAPSHVGDLDIRPEKLPPDVGRAARELWDRGEHRAALALLYRGLLSRLAHVHGIPIRDSSTEGECLSLAERLLPEPRRDYTARLVRVWQHAVYGREAIPTDSVYILCDEFAAALDPTTSSHPVVGGGAA